MQPAWARSVQLETISSGEYVRVVLPQSYALWGAGRSFERYVADFRAIAGSAYGKVRPFTVGLRANGSIACSCKNYARELRWGGRTLQATGIGAVFTPAEARGRGYATALLGALLDAERAAGRDLAFLYSDIHPVFYERIGFTTLPSRVFSLGSADLDGSRSGARALEPQDWPGVRCCFERLDGLRPWSLQRTPGVWTWMRRGWNGPSEDGSQPVALVIRSGRSVAAYALGRRVPAADTFELEEFAFDGSEGKARLSALLRAGAGDLRRVGGWLPPANARAALPRLSVRPRRAEIFMVAPLSKHAHAWWTDCGAAALAARGGDATWTADHV